MTYNSQEINALLDYSEHVESIEKTYQKIKQNFLLSKMELQTRLCNTFYNDLRELHTAWRKVLIGEYGNLEYPKLKESLNFTTRQEQYNTIRLPIPSPPIERTDWAHWELTNDIWFDYLYDYSWLLEDLTPEVIMGIDAQRECLILESQRLVPLNVLQLNSVEKTALGKSMVAFIQRKNSIRDNVEDELK